MMRATRPQSGTIAGKSTLANTYSIWACVVREQPIPYRKLTIP